MSFSEAQSHPLFFGLMMLCSMGELGLTAYLISFGNETQTWYSPRYHSLLLFLCFNASWTLLFSSIYMLWYVDGARHFLANVASSVIWLMITSILWGVGAAIFHNTRGGGNCAGRPVLHRCRQSLTVEALAWAELGICALTLLFTCFWIFTSRQKRKMVDDSSEMGSMHALQRLV